MKEKPTADTPAGVQPELPVIPGASADFTECDPPSIATSSPDPEGRLIGVEFRNFNFIVYGIYSVNSMRLLKRWSVRRLWDEKLVSLIEQASKTGHGVAIIGDFNAVHTLQNPKHLHPDLLSTAEGVPSTSRCESDSFRAFIRNSGGKAEIPPRFTFFPDRTHFAKGKGFVLDYGVTLTPWVTRIRNLNTNRFDHGPIELEVRMPASVAEG